MFEWADRSKVFRLLFVFIISLLAIFPLSGCTEYGKLLAEPFIRVGQYISYKAEGGWEGTGRSFTEWVEEERAPENFDDREGSGVYGSAGDGTTSGGLTGQDPISGFGELKPVGFVNYGEFDATVRAYTYYPLGKTGLATPSGASTVSVVNDGVGDWPNTSRFISVPMGAYSWCIDWEEGDVDDDGIIDYFHYIQDDPTILDENDSVDMESAEEVAISAPPSSGSIFEGKCKENMDVAKCVELNSEVNVYSLYAMEQGNPPQIKVAANVAEQSPPTGIDVSAGGVSTGYGTGMILWQEGDWVAVTTGDSYQAMGVQVHGDQTIGWARALYDDQEIWRGDASAHTISEGRYGVYIEVRCLPPGIHTLRIENLGQVGSGGGRSVPVSYFGFRE